VECVYVAKGIVLRYSFPQPITIKEIDSRNSGHD
jgi:hypothetical protein